MFVNVARTQQQNTKKNTQAVEVLNDEAVQISFNISNKAQLVWLHL